MAANIFLLVVCVGYLCLLAWSVKSGVVGAKGVSMHREKSPFSFWLVTILGGFLGIKFLVGAVLGIVRALK
jgi:lipid-A-disaccharide synthase-like uncharacterized protein